MNISTKYEINDVVFFMSNNAVSTAEIEKINIEIRTIEKVNIINITYLIKIDKAFQTMHESKLFPTKQELLDSL